MDFTKTIKRVVLCCKCQGKGKVEKRAFVNHTTGYETTHETCPDCNGQGRRVRIVTIKYEAYVNKGIDTE